MEILIFLIASLLIFPNLGDRCLWQDEAETALIAQHILKTGIPAAWDGYQLVTQSNGTEMTNTFLWAWTPWLMHYVAAAGMATGGENSWGARWLFALLGCFTFPLFYRIVCNLTNDRRIAALSVTFMFFSIQYLLLLRQCRYYALLPLLFFITLRGYLKLPSKLGVAAVSIGLILLFHSNYISCVIATTGLFLHAALFRRTKPVWKQLTLCALFLALCSLPWIYYTGILSRVGTSDISKPEFWINFLGTYCMSNRYICPWIVVFCLIVARFYRRSPSDKILDLCLCMMVPMFFFLPGFLWPNPRYVTFLLPIGSLLCALAVYRALSHKSWFGIAALTTLLFTNILVIPGAAIVPTTIGQAHFSYELETGTNALSLGVFKSELLDYPYELFNSCIGPDEALVSFVNTHTMPDDILFMSNDWLPVQFHTGRRIAGVLLPNLRVEPPWEQLPGYIFDITSAQWIILRPPCSNTARSVLSQIIESSGLNVTKQYVLPINDVKWINRPMLSRHIFKMPPPIDSAQIEILLIKPSNKSTRHEFPVK